MVADGESSVFFFYFFLQCFGQGVSVLFGFHGLPLRLKTRLEWSRPTWKSNLRSDRPIRNEVTCDGAGSTL